MNRRVTQDKHDRGENGSGGLQIKGVYVVRLLLCFLLGLNALLLYAIFFSSNGLPGYSKQNEQVRDLEDKIVRLKQENQKLFEMIQALKKDPKIQEKLVRQELGWVRENEVILEFLDKEKEPPPRQNLPKHSPGK